MTQRADDLRQCRDRLGAVPARVVEKDDRARPCARDGGVHDRRDAGLPIVARVYGPQDHQHPVAAQQAER